ncbi:CubicO group peptidase, beta-lactamase class C family [Nocardioides sp. YR527]|uniref:serine hydrolase domain-containing protein n=1 Tax=Nocardioides sp. YR527 TaxID=1881028 RepID=UPI0008920D00|nr:serine hydrolase domain-containing protein [Nocardioides sp. YR527]SDK24638.1 CubicO group peptidase, beta-lactamase class C family [Nocardioides sp. YR527]
MQHQIDLTPLGLATGAVIAVSRAGHRQIAEQGAATAETPFRIASLTKPLTAIATVLAAEAAGVDLETPVVDLGASSSVADPGLTVSHLLAQTSGLAPVVTGEAVAALGDGEDALGKAARLVLGAGQVRRPGDRWEYYNGNYFVAGALLASLSGDRYESALDDLLLRPWGLTRTTFAVPEDLIPGSECGRTLPVTGYPRGRRPSGGLCATASDLLTVGERLLARPRLLEVLRTVRTRREDPMRYGFGWAIGRSGQMYLNGRLPGYRAAWLIVPDHDLVVAGLAAGSEALPALARILSEQQASLTGDEIADDIDAFAA